MDNMQRLVLNTGCAIITALSLPTTDRIDLSAELRTFCHGQFILFLFFVLKYFTFESKLLLRG
jgi:hypothetical protein